MDVALVTKCITSYSQMRVNTVLCSFQYSSKRYSTYVLQNRFSCYIVGEVFERSLTHKIALIIGPKTALCQCYC